VVIFQPGKAWKQIFWSVIMEKENNFPHLTF